MSSLLPQTIGVVATLPTFVFPLFGNVISYESVEAGKTPYIPFKYRSVNGLKP